MSRLSAFYQSFFFVSIWRLSGSIELVKKMTVISLFRANSHRRRMDSHLPSEISRDTLQSCVK